MVVMFYKSTAEHGCNGLATCQQYRYNMKYGILNQSFSTELDAVIFLRCMLYLPVHNLNPVIVRVMSGEAAGVSGRYYIQATTSHRPCAGAGARVPRFIYGRIGTR